MIDSHLVRLGVGRLFRQRLPALIAIILLIGVLASLANVVQGRYAPAASQHEPSALRTIVLLPNSPRGEARPLTGAALEEIRRWPRVRDVVGTGRYGIVPVDSRWCDEKTGCIPWYLSARYPAIQPPVSMGREPEKDDEIIVAAQTGRADIETMLGQTMEIEYTFMVGPGTGEPRHRTVRVVGVFEPVPSALDGNDPAFGRPPLVRELAAASAGHSSDSFDPLSYGWPQAYVEVDEIGAVADISHRLSEEGFAADSVASLARQTPEALGMLDLIVVLLAFVVGGTSIGLGAMIGSAAVARRSTEIGLLRAVGWSTGRVMRLLIGELAAVGGITALAAVALSVVGTPVMAVLLSSGAATPWTATISLGWIMTILVGVPLSMCLGALPSIVRLSRIAPDTALREL